MKKKFNLIIDIKFRGDPTQILYKDAIFNASGNTLDDVLDKAYDTFGNAVLIDIKKISYVHEVE